MTEETSRRKTRKTAEASPSYYESYQQLKAIADKMRQQQDEPNIDELIPLVEQATAAYKHCQARIAAVENALGLSSETHDVSSDHNG